MTNMIEQDETKRTEIKSIRFSPAELAKLQANADRAGLATGAYVRQVLLEAKPPRQSRRPVVDAELLSWCLAELGKVGSNVNQLARTANQGITPDIDHLKIACECVMEIRTAILLALGYDVDLGTAEDQFRKPPK